MDVFISILSFGLNEAVKYHQPDDDELRLERGPKRYDAAIEHLHVTWKA